jgi:putative flippase GtrA
MVKPIFLKAQASSLIATATDFALTIFLVEVVHVLAIVAAGMGTFTGGVVNFLLGRNWVFKAGNQSIPKQAFRYILVWVGNFLLNIAGMTILVNIVDANYIFSKIFVSLLVGVFYNYLLQGKYVFK